MYSLSHSSCLPMGKYHRVVGFNTGVEPLKVDLGLTSSVGLRVLPHFSHWSP